LNKEKNQFHATSEQKIMLKVNKKPILYIITSLYRYAKLDGVAKSISQLNDNFSPRWFPIGDCVNGVCGTHKRNIALKMIENLESGWIYHLDDDNLIHPLFSNSLLSAIKSHKDCEVFFFKQINKNGSSYLAEPRLAEGKIDTGSYVVSTNAAKGVYWKLDNDCCPDYKWIKNVCNKGYQPKIVAGLTYYNANR